MKRLSEIYQPDAKTGRDSRPSIASAERPALDGRSLDYLWRWMTEQFGSKFIAQYGEKPCASWATTLGGLAPDELRAGLDALAKSGAKWPPSAPEFRSLCRVDRSDGAAMAARMPAERALPEPPEMRAARIAAGKRGLEQAWAAIGRKRQQEDE